MKRKYFITSFIFIIIVTVSTVLITSFYFAKERQWLLDQQIEAIASGLLANELKEAELSEMDNIVADALFDQPRTILLNIYDKNNHIVYQNSNSKNILEDELPPLAPKLFTFEFLDHQIRILNFQMPTKKMLQVGLLLDQQMSQLMDINLHMFILLGAIIIIVLSFTWLQANILVKPLEEITSFINNQTSNIETKNQDYYPSTIKNAFTSKDEIQKLWNSLHYFKTAVETKIKFTKTTMAQMAHELKTPLTIIRNTFEYLLLKKDTFSPSDLKILLDALDEVDRLNTTISRFLEWSRLESSAKNKDLHANNLVDVIQEILQSTNKLYPNHQYELQYTNNIQVFSNPEDLRQLVRNLVDNAFKYSSDHRVNIHLSGNHLVFKNSSLPIPSRVLTHLGEPFNAGKIDGSKSIGLGLAWVSSICKQYEWNFDLSYTQGETNAIIVFKDNAD